MAAAIGQMAQPLVTARQHFGEQFNGFRVIVVEMAQQTFDGAGPLIFSVQVRERVARGVAQQAFGIFAGRGRRPEARQVRHLPGERGAE